MSINSRKYFFVYYCPFCHNELGRQERDTFDRLSRLCYTCKCAISHGNEIRLKIEKPTEHFKKLYNGANK